MTTPVLTAADLQAIRAERYRRRPDLRIRSQPDAIGFLNRSGLCLLFSARSIELPSLWAALCGEDGAVPRKHNDPELGIAWRWKDSLPLDGHVLYGKFLRKTPVFVSLDLAPHFYALSPNYGDPAADYLEDYREGKLSVEAKRIYEVLLDQGALPTSRLRQDAGLGGKANASRFDRALAELQMQWRVVRVAISDANRWGYCYVYDSLHCHHPSIVEQARAISGRQARETILLRYLRTVVAATATQVGKLFEWTPQDVDRVATRLSADGQLRTGVRIEGLPGEFLVTAV